jgi:hypothetical protein
MNARTPCPPDLIPNENNYQPQAQHPRRTAVKPCDAPRFPTSHIRAGDPGEEVWSGWVGIAKMTGFGMVSLLPGIWPSLHLDTSVTLPVGVEAYAAYTLRAWLAGEHTVSPLTRRFAKWSAMCSFTLGMAGQVTYHLLAGAGATRAPWAITTIVACLPACLPVLVLAMRTALALMLRDDAVAAQKAGDRGAGQPGCLSAACLNGGGVRSDQLVIAYCGGGISATVDLFALSLTGRDDARLYDGSLTEWSAPPGPAPRRRLIAGIIGASHAAHTGNRLAMKDHGLTPRILTAIIPINTIVFIEITIPDSRSRTAMMPRGGQPNRASTGYRCGSPARSDQPGSGSP